LGEGKRRNGRNDQEISLAINRRGRIVCLKALRKKKRLIRPYFLNRLFLPLRKILQQLSNAALTTRYRDVAFKLLSDSHMMHRFKANVLPPTIHTTNQGLMVASIGGLCAAVTMAAALFLFFGA
jgi:hypothetical protein